jgi:hypothetical protein
LLARRRLPVVLGGVPLAYASQVSAKKRGRLGGASSMGRADLAHYLNLCSAQRAGWTLYQSKLMPNAREYALCPACTANPPDVDKAVALARKRRRRR